MHLSQIKRNYLELSGECALWQVFRGRTLGLADLGQGCAHRSLVLSSWARCVSGVGIGFLVCKVGRGDHRTSKDLASMNGNTLVMVSNTI